MPLSVVLVFAGTELPAQEVPWKLSEHAAGEVAPKWSETKAILIEEKDLLGTWHGITVERDYYNVWEVEYLKGGKYKLSNSSRLFMEEAGDHEDSNEVVTGTWKIQKDGVIVFDAEKKDEDGNSSAFWMKLIKREEGKHAYLTVHPNEENALATVIFEFKGKAPRVLTDLPVALSSIFEK